MDAGERAALIARYNQGYNVVVLALKGVSEQELDARPASTDWTVREIVHHLADSEMTSALRLRKLLVEDSPEIAGYDEIAYARALHYSSRPIEPALAALQAARLTSAQLLPRLTERDWAREGTHTESGRYTTEDWLTIYAAHAHEHAEQIVRARAAARGEGLHRPDSVT